MKIFSYHPKEILQLYQCVMTQDVFLVQSFLKYNLTPNLNKYDISNIKNSFRLIESNDFSLPDIVWSSSKDAEFGCLIIIIELSSEFSLTKNP